MNRRGFLKTLLAGFAAVLGVRSVPTIAKAEEVFIPSYKVWEIDPLDLFNEMKFSPGQVTEFPLDFLAPPSESQAFVSAGINKDVCHYLNANYVHVKTYVHETSGETEEDAYMAYKDVYRLEAKNLCLAAAKNGSVFASDTKQHLFNTFNKHFKVTSRNKFGRVRCFEHDGWLIGVDSHKVKRGMACVIPVRSEWKYLRSPYGYGWADLGMAILSNDGFVCGRIKE